MADKEKKKKTKKKEEAAPAPAAEAPPPEPEPKKEETKTKSPSGTPTSSARASSRGSKRAKRAGSSVFSMFSQKQVAEFKEAFAMMDHDKDGIIGKEDLRQTFDSVGRLATDKELDDMLEEVPGPINFTQLLTLFANRMSGGVYETLVGYEKLRDGYSLCLVGDVTAGSDEDDVVIAAFNTFDVNGKISGDRLKHALMTFGDKFTAKEVNDAFDNMYIDDKGFIDTPSLIDMLTGKGDDEDE